MTTFEQFSTQPAHAGVIARLQGAYAGWKAVQQRQKLYRQTVRELRALSNRELADIGLNRSMIRSVAREAMLHAHD